MYILWWKSGYRNWYSDWLRAGQQKGRSSSPGRDKNFNFFLVQIISLAHLAFYKSMPWILSARVKRRGVKLKFMVIQVDYRTCVTLVMLYFETCEPCQKTMFCSVDIVCVTRYLPRGEFFVSNECIVFDYFVPLKCFMC
jgi:hypothetical protein